MQVSGDAEVTGAFERIAAGAQQMQQAVTAAGQGLSQAQAGFSTVSTAAANASTSFTTFGSGTDMASRQVSIFNQALATSSSSALPTVAGATRSYTTELTAAGEASAQAGVAQEEYQTQLTQTGTASTQADTATQGMRGTLTATVGTFALAGGAITSLVGGILSFERSQMLVDRANVTVERSTETYTRALEALQKLQASHTASAQQLADAEQKVKVAADNLAVAHERQSVAQNRANESTLFFATSTIPQVITSVVMVISNLDKFQIGLQAIGSALGLTSTATAAASAANAGLTTSEAAVGIATSTTAAAQATSRDAIAGMTTVTAIQTAANDGLTASLVARLAPGLAIAATGVRGLATASLLFISTPLGLVLTALAIAFLAIATNAFGFRDALNAVGKAVGDALPFLRPFLDLLGQIGQFLGRTVPQFQQAGGAARTYGGDTKMGMDEAGSSAQNMSGDVQGAMSTTVSSINTATDNGVSALDKLKTGFNSTDVLVSGIAKDVQRNMSDLTSTLNSNLSGSAKIIADFDNAIKTSSGETQVFFTQAKANWTEYSRMIEGNLNIVKGSVRLASETGQTYLNALHNQLGVTANDFKLLTPEVQSMTTSLETSFKASGMSANDFAEIMRGMAQGKVVPAMSMLKGSAHDTMMTLISDVQSGKISLVDWASIVDTILMSQGRNWDNLKTKVASAKDVYQGIGAVIQTASGQLETIDHVLSVTGNTITLTNGQVITFKGTLVDTFKTGTDTLGQFGKAIGEAKTQVSLFNATHAQTVDITRLSQAQLLLLGTALSGTNDKFQQAINADEEWALSNGHAAAAIKLVTDEANRNWVAVAQDQRTIENLKNSTQAATKAEADHKTAIQASHDSIVQMNTDLMQETGNMLSLNDKIAVTTDGLNKVKSAVDTFTTASENANTDMIALASTFGLAVPTAIQGSISAMSEWILTQIRAGNATQAVTNTLNEDIQKYTQHAAQVNIDNEANRRFVETIGQIPNAASLSQGAINSIADAMINQKGQTDSLTTSTIDLMTKLGFDLPSAIDAAASSEGFFAEQIDLVNSALQQQAQMAVQAADAVSSLADSMMGGPTTDPFDPFAGGAKTAAVNLSDFSSAAGGAISAIHALQGAAAGGALTGGVSLAAGGARATGQQQQQKAQAEQKYKQEELDAKAKQQAALDAAKTSYDQSILDLNQNYQQSQAQVQLVYQQQLAVADKHNTAYLQALRLWYEQALAQLKMDHDQKVNDALSKFQEAKMQAEQEYQQEIQKIAEEKMQDITLHPALAGAKAGGKKGAKKGGKKTSAAKERLSEFQQLLASAEPWAKAEALASMWGKDWQKILAAAELKGDVAAGVEASIQKLVSMSGPAGAQIEATWQRIKASMNLAAMSTDQMNATVARDMPQIVQQIKGVAIEGQRFPLEVTGPMLQGYQALVQGIGNSTTFTQAAVSKAMAGIQTSLQGLVSTGRITTGQYGTLMAQFTSIMTQAGGNSQKALNEIGLALEGLGIGFDELPPTVQKAMAQTTMAMLGIVTPARGATYSVQQIAEAAAKMHVPLATAAQALGLNAQQMSALGIAAGQTPGPLGAVGSAASGTATSVQGLITQAKAYVLLSSTVDITSNNIATKLAAVGKVVDILTNQIWIPGFNAMKTTTATDASAINTSVGSIDTALNTTWTEWQRLWGDIVGEVKLAVSAIAGFTTQIKGEINSISTTNKLVIQSSIAAPAAPIMPKIGGVLISSAIASPAAPVMPAIRPILILSAIASPAPPVIPVIPSILIKASIDSTGVTTGLAAVQTQVGSTVTAIGNMFNSIMVPAITGAFTTAGANATSQLSTLQSGVGTAVTAIDNMFSSVMTAAVATAFTTITTSASTQLAAIQTSTGTTVTAIDNMFSGVMVSSVNTSFNLLATNANTSLARLQTSTGSAVTAIDGIFNNVMVPRSNAAFNSVERNWANVMSAMRAVTDSQVGAIIARLNSIPNIRRTITYTYQTVGSPPNPPNIYRQIIYSYGGVGGAAGGPRLAGGGATAAPAPVLPPGIPLPPSPSEFPTETTGVAGGPGGIPGEYVGRVGTYHVPTAALTPFTPTVAPYLSPTNLLAAQMALGGGPTGVTGAGAAAAGGAAIGPITLPTLTGGIRATGPGGIEGSVRNMVQLVEQEIRRTISADKEKILQDVRADKITIQATIDNVLQIDGQVVYQAIRKKQTQGLSGKL